MKKMLESVRQVICAPTMAERSSRVRACGAEFKLALVAIHWSIASMTGDVSQTLPLPAGSHMLHVIVPGA